ncbi:MAG: large-conductance mechanosensitive channel protein MscL [Candidatus Sericytochromatia bacterium]
MGFIQEFKDFAVKGNVVDLAVGVIIGGAFGKITTSAVEDLIMPPIGMVLGGLDFKDLKVVFKAGVKAVAEVKDAATGAITTPAVAEVPEVALRYGKFISTVIDFTILAFCVFIMVKAINSLKKAPAPAPATPPAPTKEEVLLTEIRDAIRASK